MRLALIACLAVAPLLGADSNQNWIGTWGTAAAPQQSDPAQLLNGKLLFSHQTVREIVRISAGGDTIRIRLSNTYAHQEATIGAAHVALSAGKSAIQPDSDHALTFAGRPSVVIPPNASVVSDPVSVHAAPLSSLAVSIFLPKPTTGGGIHYGATQTNYIAAGDQTASASLESPVTFTSWVFLSAVEVAASPSAATIVAFGDSITDGAASPMDANHRWPDYLAERLVARTGAAPLGVMNEGIGGNRVLHDPIGVSAGENALGRFDRDVLAQPGVRYLIILEAINDLGHPGTSAPLSETISAEDIIAAYTQMIERAHAKGIKVFGATLTPFETDNKNGYFTPEKEVKRKAMNNWIRTGGKFDAVIDFDKAIQDPAHPDHMAAAYDSGDHLHPKDTGYKKMADTIDLSLFQ